MINEWTDDQYIASGFPDLYNGWATYRPKSSSTLKEVLAWFSVQLQLSHLFKLITKFPNVLCGIMQPNLFMDVDRINVLIAFRMNFNFA